MLSRACVRRLSHDAGQRLAKGAYNDALIELSRFVEAMAQAAARAAVFTRHRAIKCSHVRYAARTLMVLLPEELSHGEPHRLQRANIRAPASQRKKNPLHAEVAEAAFIRVLKQTLQPRPRMSASARRLLQLICEQHLLQFFAPSQATSPAVQDESTVSVLQRSLAVDAQLAERLAHFLTVTINHVPALLSISKTQTVDARVIDAAVSTQLLCPATQVPCKNLLRICERILRGRCADNRVSAAAVERLASALLHAKDNCSERLPLLPRSIGPPGPQLEASGEGDADQPTLAC